MTGFSHQPVLVDEVLGALTLKRGALILDGTIGGGGHSRVILEKDPDVRVIGLDQDGEAVEAASKNLKEFGQRVMIQRSNYSDAAGVLSGMGISTVDGILLDLGVSSHQLDTAERGFSFNKEAALDMRMDQRAPLTAAEVVNSFAEYELENIFREYGQEPAARRIARGIVHRRAEKAFVSTTELAGFIESLLGGKRGKTHPATRAFQALRIEVNNELGVLSQSLESLSGLLVKKGRFAVITFHSLEDRLVKRFFRSRSELMIDDPTWPAPRRNPDCIFKLVTRRPLVAGEREISDNPRCRSAKLRVAEKL